MYPLTCEDEDEYMGAYRFYLILRQSLHKNLFVLEKRRKSINSLKLESYDMCGVMM